MRKKTLTTLTMAAMTTLVAGLFTGCTTVNKTSPHMGFSSVNMEAQIDREDIEVLDPVEGSSTQTSILGPVIRVVDGDKYQIMGIKFFEDKSAMLPGTGQNIVSQLISAVTGVSVQQRAYYDALAATPDADSVFTKASTVQQSGIPFLFETKKATFHGKALKLKTD